MSSKLYTNSELVLNYLENLKLYQWKFNLNIDSQLI